MIEIERGLWFEEETGLPYSSKRSNGSTKGVTFDNPLKRLTGQNKGYLTVRLEGKQQYWHRILWVYFNGPIPVGKEVDHLDNNPLNNRLDNLQLLNHSDNTRYQKMHNTNTSGLPGVSWFKSKKKWNAQIAVNCKRIYLGSYDDINEAYYVYYHAKILHHGIESVRCLPQPILEEEKYDDLN